MIEVLVPSLVANFLLPYVKDGLQVIAKKVAESAGEAAGEEAASVTKRVWARVQRLFGGRPEDETVLKDFEEDPDATAAYLQKRLTKLLEANPEATHELAALAKAPAPGSGDTIATIIGNSGVTATITMKGNTLSGGSSVIGINQLPPPATDR